MNISQFSLRRISTFAVCFVVSLLAAGAQSAPDPLLRAGEEALVGTYRLDNVLLAPGQLLVIHQGNPLFDGAGDSLEHAAAKGLLNSNQVAVLSSNCTLKITAAHAFSVTNLPAESFSRNINFDGSWSMKVYHVFDTYGYRISTKGSPNDNLVLLRFFNADKPSSPILDMIYKEGKRDQAIFHFTRIEPPPPHSN